MWKINDVADPERTNQTPERQREHLRTGTIISEAKGAVEVRSLLASET